MLLMVIFMIDNFTFLQIALLFCNINCKKLTRILQIMKSVTQEIKRKNDNPLRLPSDHNLSQ